jgi:hypothetical protein
MGAKEIRFAITSKGDMARLRADNTMATKLTHFRQRVEEDPFKKYTALVGLVFDIGNFVRVSGAKVLSAL